MTQRFRSGRFFIKLRNGKALRVTLDNGVITSSSVVRRRAKTPLLSGCPEVLQAARALQGSPEADNGDSFEFPAVVAKLEVALSYVAAENEIPIGGSAIKSTRSTENRGIPAHRIFEAISL